MKTRLLLATGVAFFILFVVVLLPARVALDWLAPPRVSMTGVTGTIWSGAAAQVGIDGVLLGRLRWSDGSWLALIGRPSWQLELDRSEGFLRGRVGASLAGDLRISNLEGATPIRALKGLVPVGNNEGEVSVRIDELSITGGQLERIRGRVVIDRLRPPDLREGDLGTIQLRFDGEATAPLNGTVEVGGGPIAVRDGRIDLQPDGRYLLRGRIASTPGAPREIVEALRFISGEPDSEGFGEFSLQGGP